MKSTPRFLHRTTRPGTVLLGLLFLAMPDGHATPDEPAVCAWARPILAARAQSGERPDTAASRPSPPGAKPFETGLMPGNGPAKQVSLDVKGQRWLRLVGIVRKGTGNCHIWGNARLIAADGSEKRLCDLKPTAVNVGWGQLLTNKNWQNHPLKIADRQFDHGVWVHADSDVCYELGGKYERFEAWVGLDADRATGEAEFKVHFDPPSRQAQTSPKRSEAQRRLLHACPGMKEFLAVPAHAGLEAEWAHQYRALEYDLRSRARLDKVAEETFRPESLIH